MNFTRCHFIRVSGAAALAATAGCDQIPKGFIPGLAGKPVRSGPFTPPVSVEIDLVSHALNRLTFGVRPGDYTRVKALGATGEEAMAAFLDVQLAPETMEDHWCAQQIGRAHV